jgi:hypothetical protein
MDAYSLRYFQCLSEKDKRRFAGLEARRLGWHGVTKASQFYGLHPHAVRKGKKELEKGQNDTDSRIRREGGGRKNMEIKYPNLDAEFLDVLKEHTAGDPMDDEVQWTHLSDKEINVRLKAQGIPVGVSVVKRLLKKHGYRRRKAVKTKVFKNVPERNTQFEQIAAVGETEADSPNPILSIDTKKKSISGNYIERDEYT